MAAKKRPTKAKKPVPKKVPGTNREHRMIDSREIREDVKSKRVNGGR